MPLAAFRSLTEPQAGATYTLGKTADGTGTSASSANKTAVSKWTAAADGTLTAGHARLSVTGGSSTTRVVVYADATGAPGALLAGSDEVVISNTVEQQIDYVFSGAAQAPIVSGTDYWIGAAWTDPGTDSVNLSRDATVGARQETSSYAPASFGTPAANAGPADAWVEFTSGTPAGGVDLADPTIVQANSFRASTGQMTQTAAPIYFAQAAVAGNVLVYCLGGDKNTGSLTMSDNVGTNGGANPWTVEQAVVGASVSVYLAWKVAVGGETTITGTVGTAPVSGNNAWAGEVAQDGTAAWGVSAEAGTAYSDSAVSARSTGTTGATSYKGIAFATVAVDSYDNATAGSWSNAYASTYAPGSAVGDGGGAALYVGTTLVARTATTESTWTKTAGAAADQMAGAVVVLGRQGLAAVIADATRFFLSAA